MIYVKFAKRLKIDREGRAGSGRGLLPGRREEGSRARASPLLACTRRWEATGRAGKELRRIDLGRGPSADDLAKQRKKVGLNCSVGD
jgi:hypothetical protein